MAQDLPTPKYKIGDIVWTAGVDTVTKTLPCPDCLGSRKWLVRTPAGVDLECACLRCADRYRNSDVPSLAYSEYVGTTHSLTIGSIRIDTAANPEWHDEPVQYMCAETGIGSGTIYRESKMFATQQEAREIADTDATTKNAKEQALPERLEKVKLSGLPFEAAHLKLHNHSIWNAWYAYRSLRKNIESILDDASKNAISAKEIPDAIRDQLDDDARYRSLPDIEKVINLLNHAAETGDVAPLKGVLERFADLRRDVPATPGDTDDIFAAPVEA